MDKIKVLYILGPGKNGSTLLERILGSIKNFFAIGEIPNIWREGYGDDVLCSCKVKFSSCKFWRNVTKEAFPNIPYSKLREVLLLRDSVHKIYHLPFLMFPSIAPRRYNRNLCLYKELVSRIYKAISKNAPGKVLVDSSKNSMHCLILCQIPEIELYVIDLLRDSRAVAFSWQRKSIRPDIYWKKAFMKRNSVISTSRKWIQSRLGASLIKNRCKAYHFLKYEELIKEPKKKIIEMLAAFGFKIKQEDIDFLNKKLISFGEFHSISGNPMRFIEGEIELKEDREWVTQMSLTEKMITTLFTYPLLKKHKYL